MAKTNGISAAKELIHKFSEENEGLISELDAESGRLADACDEINRSWSGSFIGHHGSYYYGNLTPPPANSRWNIEWGTIYGVPSGWNAWGGDSIKAEVEKRADLNIQDFSKKTEKLVEAAEKLKTDIEIELSDFDFDGMEKESVLFSEIEKIDFDINQARTNYINLCIPKAMMSRDSEAMMEGTYIPSHVTSKAGAYAANRMIERIKEFLSKVDRLTRQIEKKEGTLPKSTQYTALAPLIKLEKILSRFHGVAQQLQERHTERSTLVIQDEYDVQDLLHSLLKIDFDDIRPEEWTPSYAGSSTRMDFVLKKEGIVIEVKKTNFGLRDKQIGEQLILDIAHYKTSRDCKTLFCFIYDPKSLLKNREGLISDLQRMHDGLDVKVVISP